MWAYIITHPIQYYTPVLQHIARSAPDEVQVLYCSGELESSHSQAGFGVKYRWDVPLLEGYRSRFLENRAPCPSTTSFGGLDNPEVSRIIASRKYSAVVVNGWHFKTAWRAIFACWSNRIPVLVRGDSHLRAPWALRKSVKWPIYRSFVPRLDGCLAAGSWSREYFQHYGAPRNRVFTVPHCVDNQRFAQQRDLLAPQRQELRRKWGIPTDAIVFLFVGKFIPVKRPLDFVKAIGRCAAERPSVMGLMAGDGPLRQHCEEQARGAGTAVRFTGFLNQTQIAEAYAVANAVVLPSETESWGLVVNEAMASGLPCFVSDRVGCNSDLIQRGETGDIYETGDIAGMAKMMVQYADSDRLAAMGHIASHKIESYSVEAAAKALLSAVNTVERRHKYASAGCNDLAIHATSCEP
jgi:glycosyltransferase involved in cell wall biosynthesis